MKRARQALDGTETSAGTARRGETVPQRFRDTDDSRAAIQGKEFEAGQTLFLAGQDRENQVPGKGMFDEVVGQFGGDNRDPADICFAKSRCRSEDGRPPSSFSDLRNIGDWH